MSTVVFAWCEELTHFKTRGSSTMIAVDLIQPISVLLKRHAKRSPQKVAYSDSKTSITYHDLRNTVEALSINLRERGLLEGETVAVWLPNSVSWVISCLAIIRAGGVCVPISYESTSSEVAYRLNDAACKMVFTRSEKQHVIQSELDKRVSEPIVIIEDWSGTEKALNFITLCSGERPKQTLPDDDIERASLIVYTSGTTGQPKGVVLSTRSMLWVTAACWVPALGMTDADVVLSPLPLFHSYAINISVLSVLAVGATEHIMERFSTSEVISSLKEGGFTLMPGVPTMFQYLLQTGKQLEVVIGTKTRFVSAGAIMPAKLNDDFEAYFGTPLLDGYGITETSTMVTMNWLGKSRIAGSCGLPVIGLSVRLVDPADGSDVPIGKEGELICRGPNLMIGYHNKPNETAKAVVNGWYHTGDLAKSDKNGFLTITGRLKELIIRGGQNIAPAEVEETIFKYDGVLDCAVVGVPDENYGEVPVAFVTVADEEGFKPESLIQFCAKHMSKYKVPTSIHLIDAIPRTGSGKTIRFKLKEKLA